MSVLLLVFLRHHAWNPCCGQGTRDRGQEERASCLWNPHTRGEGTALLSAPTETGPTPSLQQQKPHADTIYHASLEGGTASSLPPKDRHCRVSQMRKRSLRGVKTAQEGAAGV